MNNETPPAKTPEAPPPEINIGFRGNQIRFTPDNTRITYFTRQGEGDYIEVTVAPPDKDTPAGSLRIWRQEIPVGKQPLFDVLVEKLQAIGVPTDYIERMSTDDIKKYNGRFDPPFMPFVHPPRPAASLKLPNTLPTNEELISELRGLLDSGAITPDTFANPPSTPA